MSKPPVAVTKLLVGTLLFVGLPLVGWGIADLQGFLAHPARLAYVVLIILLQLGVVIAFPDVGRGSGVGRQAVPRQRIAVLLLQLLSAAILLAAAYGDRRDVAALGESAIIRYLGLVLLASGFIVMMWAEMALGRHFSLHVTIQEGHQLVTGGLYRYLRHPRYLGIIVFNVGIALVYRSGLALMLIAALLAVLLWRIHDEELLLRNTFKGEWESYSRRSWRLLPFVH